MPMSLTGWKPRPGSAVRVLRDPKTLDHHGAPGVWMVVDKHPEKGSWWLQPYDAASRVWADTHPDRVKTMNRPGSLLLSAAMPLPKDVR
ncbi:hypothetical protein [Blastococcus sp. CT_GayMR16]|uniref:hypothetical protein n=1 Tax=Blastococcus sp. CT_GayMR16 TaxID=2559607 RepID=UPI00107364C8|nr:hypothetical protein [Blastococcus sp. CT_GayMR16]TFV83130.1 hypothetical protein E4P38_20970 [Blastococcus sp. CT_GayMR16]